MSLTASEQYCLDEVRRHDHDRYLTALFLPANRRSAALALYAFNLEIARTREIMGATNPADAAEGTIRKEFAESIEANSVHGSDAPETAAEEIAFFFDANEIVG